MIKIDLLKNHLETIQALATIWYEGLGKIWLPELSVDYIKEELVGSWMNEMNLPLAHIAMIDGVVAGVASLQDNCGIRPDLTPWLGSLVIDPNYQKQGIGKMLMNATKEKAQQLGFNKLYLFAFDPTLPQYYERLGWRKMGMDEFNTHAVMVMEIEL